MVLAETFEHSIFRQSLARLFTTGPDGHLDQGFNATIEVGLPKVRAARISQCMKSPDSCHSGLPSYSYLNLQHEESAAAQCQTRQLRQSSVQLLRRIRSTQLPPLAQRLQHH